MPTIITGEPSTGKVSSADLEALGRKYDYDYPNDLDLRPGSDLHKRIRDEIYRRAYESHRVMSSRYDSWRKVDETLTAYIPTDEVEDAIKRKDVRKPVSIIFPYSYAMLETVLTYLMSAFLQEPIFRYEGVKPEDMVGTILMELVVQLQCNRAKVGLPIHTMLRDSLAYGMGIGAPGWEVHEGWRTVRQQTGIFSNIFGMMKQKDRRERVRTTLYEGNTLNNIDPYNFLPDAGVGIHDIQRGEYVGYVDHDNYMNMLEDEQWDEDVFNVRYLKEMQNRTSIFSHDQSHRGKKFGMTLRERYDHGTTHRVDNINMYIKLIPSDWELGSEDTPQKWKFRLSADEIITQAKPLGLDHDLFPIVTAAPDFDGYSTAPIGRLEVMYGLQHLVDWFINSHVANVRKAINDMIIVDPYLINMPDLRDPKPGGLIRLRRPAWGRGVTDAAMQLKVTDITQAHIQDVMVLIGFMERIAGADPSMQGAMRQGGPERLTGKEFQGTRASGMGRLERIARIVGMQALQDIGFMFAAHNQQLMTEETYVNVVGKWPMELFKELKPSRGRVKISPYDLLVNYDVIIRDGSVPGGNFADVWVRLFQQIINVPELANTFDVPRIFKHIARNLGARNVNEFVRDGGGMTPELMPDDQVADAVQRGKAIPLEAA